MSIFDWLTGEKGQLLQSGLAGSAVAAAVEWTGIMPSLRKIIVGSLCALYLSPIAVPMLSWALGMGGIPIENAAGVSGFLMGVGGIIVIEIVLKAFRFRRDNFKPGSGGAGATEGGVE